VAKSDHEKAKDLKDKAASDFKAQRYEDACEKYYRVLNIIRQNNQLKQSGAGKELDTQTRLNIALCKLNTKDYDVAIDQCEMVLDKDPNNWKAAFRLATAVYQKTDKCS
jgi:tetratricopeptide (TPR) repeat protein